MRGVGLAVVEREGAVYVHPRARVRLEPERVLPVGGHEEVALEPAGEVRAERRHAGHPPLAGEVQPGGHGGVRGHERAEVRHRLELPRSAPEPGEEAGEPEARVGLEAAGVEAEGELLEIGDSVAVGVERGVRGVEGVEAGGGLPAVGASVAVGVGEERVRAEGELLEVGEPVGVEVLRAVPFERREVRDLPLVRQRVAVGGEPGGARGGDGDVVHEPVAAAESELRGRGRPGAERPEDDRAVEVEVPLAGVPVYPRREARPRLRLHGHGPVGAPRGAVEGHGVAEEVEEDPDAAGGRRRLGGGLGEDLRLEPRDAGREGDRMGGRGPLLAGREPEARRARGERRLLHAGAGGRPPVLAGERPGDDEGPLEALGEKRRGRGVGDERARAAHELRHVGAPVAVGVGEVRVRAVDQPLGEVAEAVQV